MKRIHSIRFKRVKKILKNFGLLWQALRKFNDDNGFFLSSGITLVIFVLWVYYSSTILVVGGEFAYFLEEDRQRSTV